MKLRRRDAAIPDGETPTAHQPNGGDADATSDGEDVDGTPDGEDADSTPDGEDAVATSDGEDADGTPTQRRG
ncbi:MAG: hypothetical protein J6T46_11520, partial [Victivallales bacterium]|nr:hypothetical protein [Victivallales bacterium]